MPYALRFLIDHLDPVTAIRDEPLLSTAEKYLHSS